MIAAEQTEYIYHRLTEKLNHPYVRRCLPQPIVDRDKIVIYHHLFCQRVHQESVAPYVESAMVAEMGLSTHETMTNEALTDKKQLRKRQLTALSGDLYSALYYYALAREGDVEVVRWIAQAIQTFNIDKCRLFYPKQSLDWAQAIEALGAIESALISKVAAMLGFPYWGSLLINFFLTKKLIYERKQFTRKSRGSFLIHHLMEHLTKEKSAFEERLNEEIHCAKTRFYDQLRENRAQFASEAAAHYLRDKMDEFFRYKVEEG